MTSLFDRQKLISGVEQRWCERSPIMTVRRQSVHAHDRWPVAHSHGRDLCAISKGDEPLFTLGERNPAATEGIRVSAPLRHQSLACKATSERNTDASSRKSDALLNHASVSQETNGSARHRHEIRPQMANVTRSNPRFGGSVTGLTRVGRTARTSPHTL